MSFGFGFGMAKAAAFLSGPVPSLNLQFAGNTVLDPRITFTRASSATYFDSAGVLTTASNNVARLTYAPVTLEPLGLLIEEQRTNLLTYSEQFDNAAWTKTNSSITANTIVSPDGTLTADKLVEDTATAVHQTTQQGVASIASGNTYSFSVFLKAAERGFAFVGLGGTGFVAVPYISVNLSSGAVATTNGFPVSSSAVAVGNGWWRVTLVGTTTATGSVVPDIRLSADGVWANRSYTGNGTSGIYVWGAQLEAGAFSTSYIPTVAAQVTRSADSAVMTGTNFSSWYRQDEGTFYSENQTLYNHGSAFPGVFSANNGTTTDQIMSYYIATNRQNLYVRVGGSIVADIGPTAVANAPFKFAGAFRQNDFATTTNGLSVSTDTLGNLPTPDRLTIGSQAVGNAPLNGTIRKLAFYPSRLSSTQLQALTA